MPDSRETPANILVTIMILGCYAQRMYCMTYVCNDGNDRLNEEVELYNILGHTW